MYAGHGTRFVNLVAHVADDPRIRPSFTRISGWKNGGVIERAAFVPAAVRGRARAAIEGAPFARLPRPDVIWSGASEVLTPHLWAQMGPLRRPLVLDLDWTLVQGEEWAPIYFNRAPKRGLRRALALWQERALWRSVSLFVPWSRWAAGSLRQQGIEDDRIMVMPPGVDLRRWSPQRTERGGDAPLNLLFVGGDFARKGGELLLDVFRTRFADRCELHIVTRDNVAASPNVFVHRAEPNSPLLRDLYARADLFVLPTRAEAFGIAAIEALASGLPVILGNVGGTGDIVDDDDTGWLIQPESQALADAIERALAQRSRLPQMGERARRAAEERFDGARNDNRLVETLVDLAARAKRIRHE